MASIESIEYSERFLRKLSHLPKRLVDAAQKKERLFKFEPFHPSLRSHKRHGKDKDAWAFWIDYRYRVKFFFVNEKTVVFLDVGPHNIYE